MKTLITAPFADTRAADLRLTHGLAALPALTTHEVVLPGARLQLRLLGASHQVLLDLGGRRWSETVACDTDASGALPRHHEAREGGLAARFRARWTVLDPAALTTRVAALRRRCESDPAALVGTFPGSPLAITALLVEAQPDGGVGWRTWHVYPQSGELVATRSMVTG